LLECLKYPLLEYIQYVLLINIVMDSSIHRSIQYTILKFTLDLLVSYILKLEFILTGCVIDLIDLFANSITERYWTDRQAGKKDKHPSQV